VHDAIKAAVREFGGDDVAIEPLERFEFYDASREQPPVIPARQHSPCQEDEFIECAVWIYRGSVCGCSVWRGTQAVRERLVAKGLPLFYLYGSFCASVYLTRLVQAVAALCKRESWDQTGRTCCHKMRCNEPTVLHCLSHPQRKAYQSLLSAK
jgi:hypothetical protein